MSDESDIKRIENENASTSILDIPSFIKNYQETKDDKSTIDNVIEDKIDEVTNEYANTNLFTISPAFIPYVFHLPKVLFMLANNTENCPFKFKLSPDNLVKIESDTCTQIFDMHEYGTFFVYNGNHIFLYGKRKYIRKFKSKENREFKKSVEEKEKYTRSDVLTEYKEYLYTSQIKHKFNIYYVDVYDDLLSILKTLVQERKENTIKTRKFGIEMQKEQLEYILNSVPGVGKNVAKSMCIRFTSLCDFVNGLYEMKEEDFVDLPVVLDDGENTRKLGHRQYEILARVFLSRNPNERVQ